MGGPTLLATKLHPPVRRGLMHRRRLVQALDGAARHQLTLLVTPAGWGKTSLLADWHATGHSDRIGWLALDPEDNDPVRFWSYLIAAVRTVLPDAGGDALATLGMIERAIRTLPERQRTVLVLRDVGGWPANEVCALVGVSTGNQRVLLHRARAAVRATLTPYLDDVGRADLVGV